MSNSDAIITSLRQLVDLRIVVLALGETQHYGWWKSQFLSQTGVSFLDRIFPRTKFAAAIQSSSLVARLAHDTSIGRGDIIHLFRIPSREEQINEYSSENASDLQRKFLPVLSNREELLKLLSGIASSTISGKQAGPVRLSQAQWDDFPLLTSIYLQGFINQSPVYPYCAD